MAGMKSIFCFLFDLDGTLILTGGAGLRAFDQAFKSVFQVSGKIKAASPAGKTDPVILRIVCEKYLKTGPTPEQEKAFFECYLDRLALDLESAPQYQIMPGIEPLLKRLADDDRCILGLGTGNIREGAKIKLMRSDLWRFFSFGGFGSDARDRSKLLEKAIQRGRAQIGENEEIREVIVVGDTPHDVHAGQAIGARTVAVATGPFDRADLEATGADLVYEDLGDYLAFLHDLGLA